MSVTYRKGRTWPLGLVSSLMILAGTAAAQAGGFSLPYVGFSEGTATSQTNTSVEAARAEYSSQTFAEVETSAERGSLDGPTEVFANAQAGNFTTFVVEDGKAEYEQKKSAKSRVYVKEDNVLAKARAENHTVIYIDGRAYVVVDELARALSRTTQKGTRSVSDADTTITASSNGYLEVNTGTTTEATVRTSTEPGN